jgi:tight adherence protein B
MATNPLVLLSLIGLVSGIGIIVMTMLELGRERAATAREEGATKPVTTLTHSGDKRTRRLDQALAASPALRRAVEVTADLAQRRGALGSVERTLRAADVPVRPAEMILLNMFAAVVVPVGAFLLTGSPTKTIMAFVLAAAGPIVTLRFMAKRRTKKFNAQLPDALTTLAGSLRAGRSVGQAMAVMSQELAAPMGRELRKVVAEVRLGRSLNETLDDAAERVGSEDFKWAILAMQIQSEVGGNLAELLDQVAATMRERSRMKGEVKALTAEGRASAMMLVIMVPGLGLAMSVMNPKYMSPLWETSTGHILLGVSALMVTGGYLWMNSMVKIDV